MSVLISNKCSYHNHVSSSLFKSCRHLSQTLLISIKQPSDLPTYSSAPSQQPSESSEPSLAPSNSPRVTSLAVVEPDGVSKTVNCCESGGFDECSELLSIAQVEVPEECPSESPSTSARPSLHPSLVPSSMPSSNPTSSGIPSSVVSCLF